MFVEVFLVLETEQNSAKITISDLRGTVTAVTQETTRTSLFDNIFV